MLFTVLIQLISIFLRFGDVSHRSYYVAPTGDNAYPGTLSSPWRTIQYAVTNDLVGPGDVIYILPGIYQENIHISAANGGVQGTPGQPVTITAYDYSNPPVIQGLEQTVQFLIEDRSHLVVSHLIIADYLGGGLLVRSRNADVTNITIRLNRFSGQRVNEKRDWWNTVNIVAQNRQFSASYIYIKNNYFENIVTGTVEQHNEVCSLTGNVHHVLIEDNTFRNVSYIAIDLLGKAYGPINGQPSYVIVRNNRFEAVTSGEGNGKAIYFDGAAGPVVVENNFIQDAVGVHTNIERNNNGDNTFAHYLIRNNVVDNRRSDIGPSLMIGSGSYGNTEKWPVEPEDVAVVHNVVLTRAKAPPIFWGQGKEFRFKNNIVAGFGTKDLTGENRNGFANASTWLSNGNLYYAGGGGESFVWPGFGRYDSLDEFQSETGQEVDGVIGMPVFADIGNEDFRLAPFSPGAGQGVALTQAVNNGRNSTSLLVEDAGYFFDGFGLVDGDRIRLGDVMATVAQVDYDANRIVLTSPASWDAGAPIGYAESGLQPSMGLARTLECRPIFLCRALPQLRAWLEQLP